MVTYIEKHLGRPLALRSLADRFLDLVSELRRASIAHADLQHGNILVINGNLRLIDYDGMYVPGLDGRTSHELGHRNYQHPNRSGSHFGPYLDHFAAWVIYLSLIALSIEPNLWAQARTGDEQLLFRQDDFEHPEHSRPFQAIKRIRDPQLQFLLSLFESFLTLDLHRIPPLDQSQLSRTASVPTWSSSHPNGPRPPVDLGKSVQDATQAVPTTFVGPSWIADHLEALPVVSFTPRLFLERLVMWHGEFLVGVLSVAGASGVLGLEAAFLSVAGLVALVYLFLSQRFGHRPEVSAKAHLSRAVADLQAEILRMKATLDGLAAQLNQWKRAESNLFDDTRGQQQDLLQREQGELTQVDAELSRTIAQLDAQRKALDLAQANEVGIIGRELQRIRDDLRTCRQTLNQNEAKEITDALKQAHQQQLSAQLANFRLDSANIEGIGEALKKRLSAKGIRTAADIVNVHVSQRFRRGHPHEIVYIEVPGKGNIHIDGIGLKKATALLNWQRGIESQFQRSIPQSLPPGVEVMIRERYLNQRRTLDAQEVNASAHAERQEPATKAKYQSAREDIHRQEARAKEGAAQKRGGVRNTYRLQRDALTKQVERAQQTLAQECSDLARQIDEKQKEFAEQQWVMLTRKRELEAYQEISFRAYLRQIVSLRRRSLYRSP